MCIFCNMGYMMFGPQYPPAPDVVPDAERVNTWEHRTPEEQEDEIRYAESEYKSATEGYHVVIVVEEIRPETSKEMVCLRQE